MDIKGPQTTTLKKIHPAFFFLFLNTHDLANGSWLLKLARLCKLNAGYYHVEFDRAPLTLTVPRRGSKSVPGVGSVSYTHLTLPTRRTV